MMKEDHLQQKKKTLFADEASVSVLFPLDDIFSHHARHIFLRIFSFFLALSILAVLVCVVLIETHSQFVLGSMRVAPNLLLEALRRAGGVFFIVFALWCFVYVIEAFYRSVYYHNREQALGKKEKTDHVAAEVVEYFYKNPDNDLLSAFLRSEGGKMTMLRLGIGQTAVHDFLHGRAERGTTSFYEIKTHGVKTRVDLGKLLYQKHEAFSQFLFSRAISEKTFLGALEWVVALDIRRKYHERWWAKGRLAKIPSFGGEWSYGRAYTLERYATTVSGIADDETSSDYKKRRGGYVKQVENILSKRGEANVLLVGEEGVGLKKVLGDVARRCLLGKNTPELAGRRIVMLDSELLISDLSGKNNFEQTFMKILAETERAGNIILGFYDFGDFITSARTEGVNVLSILEKYLQAPEMKIIALTNKGSFHQALETNPVIASGFEVVTLEEPEYEEIIGILEDNVLPLEYQYGIFFTYTALLEIARSAKYYITEGVMPDKALDLLEEAAPIARSTNEHLVTKETVQKLVSEKTHIPMGEIDQKEGGKLQNLESSMHELVVGQEKAIKALSSTLRRSRTGLRNMEKPVGSFLFLGPTGVGKTQTAKALAKVYFDDEEAMSRIDMSEYNAPDALTRLIGSFESGKVGTLTTLVKARPYGVLLLDELEKASKDVHDLFLQILDEGFFSDMNGQKVNARNLIFIATSNAGSDKIWAAAKEGRDVSKMKDELVQYVVDSGIFHPEFLNRFDEVIVFHPLSKVHLRDIAKNMLVKTQERIKERGYELAINDPLIDFTVKQGYDPTFGARPMEHAIKDTVEEIIAQKIISGEVIVGDTISLSADDFSNLSQ